MAWGLWVCVVAGAGACQVERHFTMAEPLCTTQLRSMRVEPASGLMVNVTDVKSVGVDAPNGARVIAACVDVSAAAAAIPAKPPASAAK